MRDRIESCLLLVLAVGLGIYASIVGRVDYAVILFALAVYALLSLLWGLIRRRHA
jgi:hypothetical protein